MTWSCWLHLPLLLFLSSSSIWRAAGPGGAWGLGGGGGWFGLRTGGVQPGVDCGGQASHKSSWRVHPGLRAAALELCDPNPGSPCARRRRSGQRTGFWASRAARWPSVQEPSGLGIQCQGYRSGEGVGVLRELIHIWGEDERQEVHSPHVWVSLLLWWFDVLLTYENQCRYEQHELFWSPCIRFIVLNPKSENKKRFRFHSTQIQHLSVQKAKSRLFSKIFSKSEPTAGIWFLRKVRIHKYLLICITGTQLET